MERVHHEEPDATPQRPREPEPLPPLLALQRFAGNQAVARHLARTRTLARWAGPPGARRCCRRSRPRAWPSCARSSPTSKRPTRPATQIGVTLPLQSVMVSVADAAQLRTATIEKLRLALMFTLANGRQTLFVSMQGAANETDRRTRTVALRAFDAPLLADIRRYATSPATRFKHDDPAVQDGVLAAMQLEAIASAEGFLASPKDAHEKSWKAASMAASFDWCGFFAMENYMLSNLDTDLKRGYFHVDNVEDYFTYKYAFGEWKYTRVMKWIYAEDDWHDLRDYHTARGSERTWIPHADIADGGALDIRPGDIALIDHSGTKAADHIVMVHSYDMTTNTLFTIGGNDGGYMVDTRATHTAPKGESEAAKAKRENLEAATGQPLRSGGAEGHVGVGSRRPRQQGSAVRIYGIGRPSIVDFEDHRYDSTDAKRPPRRPRA